MQLLLSTMAAVCFTVGGIFMKHADGLRKPLPCLGFLTLFAIGATLQSLAMKGAEMGVTYILVLGLEASLAFGFGVVWLSEPLTLAKTGALMLIVAGIALLRA